MSKRGPISAQKIIAETPRGMAVEILNRVALGDAYAEPLLDACLSSNYLPNIHDRRLLTQIVYGVLRMQGHLDWLIGKLYRGRFITIDINVKNILRTGLYQLIYVNRIPVFAVVDEAVKLAKALLPESAGLVNAILRNYIRKRGEIDLPDKDVNPIEYTTVVHSHPKWLVKRWAEAFDMEETISLCTANNEIPPAVIRVNRLKTNRDNVIEGLIKEGFESKKTRLSPDGIIISGSSSLLRNIHIYEKGLIQLQDEASQLIAHLLAPSPGEQVLDACAGSGIKTTQIAEMMENCGCVLAVDINEKKLISLKGLTEKLGITIVETKIGDAALDMGGSFYERFDRVLVDAPCSGLGTLRRNPEIKWRITSAGIKSLAAIQKKILDGISRCLKPGGSLVYSVCTIMPEENEAIVEDFLSRNSDFKLATPMKSLPPELIDKKGFFRTSPNRHGTDGFFAALMVRQG